MKYHVQVGDARHEVVVDGDHVTIDGREVRARIEQLPDTPFDVATVGDAAIPVHARRGDEKGTFQLLLDGYRLEVEALDDRARTIRDMSGAAARAAGPSHLKAPMPGLIVRINVAEGDQVKAGQGLVVMEAMKMENELRAASNAVVVRVAATVGSAVEKGALLLELGPVT